MKHEPDDKSHALAWVLVVLLVPVLYLLSVPPVKMLTAVDRDATGYVAHRWAQTYGETYEWLQVQIPPLRAIFSRYHMMWWELTD